MHDRLAARPRVSPQFSVARDSHLDVTHASSKAFPLTTIQKASELEIQKGVET